MSDVSGVGVEVREFGVGDSDRLVALFAAVLPDSPIALRQTGDGPDAFLDDPATFAFGAYVGDEPIGLAWGIQMRSPSGRLTTYLHQLDVREEWRRQGAASALIRSAMELGRRRGSDRFWLSTGRHNEVAQAVYESLGGDRKPLGDVNYWWSLD